MPSVTEQLDRDGFAVLPDLLTPDRIAALRGRVETLFAREGDAAGSEFKQESGARRLANLVAKGEVFWELLDHKRVLPAVAHVLGGSVKLSSLNVRSTNPHGHQVQPLHCDMGAVADATGYWVCNVVWLLDDFTTENGALRVVPGSHRLARLPQESLPDLQADHPEQRLLTAQAGAAIVLNAHLWHGGMANLTARPRTAIHAFYCRRDKPQQQYQKQLLPMAVQAALPPTLRALLALDDAANDRLAQASVSRSGFLK